MDESLKTDLESLSNDMKLDLDSREFALAMDKQDPHHELRQMFFYPKMKDLPLGELLYYTYMSKMLIFCV